MIAALRQTEKKDRRLPVMVKASGPSDFECTSNLFPAVPARMKSTAYWGSQAYLEDQLM